MSGTLFVVATPIGNLEDITFRAVRVLRETGLIAAEDTRRTAKLLARHGVATPMLSFHAHNIRTRLPALLARLEQGTDVALVTDAGTPGVSDPGVELVRACRTQGIPVEPVPGPSAPLTAAAASGFPLEPLTIFGFVPVRSKDRTEWMEEISRVHHTFTFFEAPHRIGRTLADLSVFLGDRQIVVARELTKVHEEFISGKASDLAARLTKPRGEFTIVVGPQPEGSPAIHVASDREIAAEFGSMTECGRGSRRGKIAMLAKKHGRSPKDVYAIVERVKKSSGV